MIDLLPGEDQQALLESIYDFLRDEAPVEPAVPTDIWSQIADLGWLGLTLAEDAGGAGLGSAEEMLLLRECGRFLFTPSVMATLAAIRIAQEAGRTALAGEFGEGSKRVALAMPVDQDSVYLIDGERADFMLIVEEEAAFLCEKTGNGKLSAASDARVSLSIAPRSAAIGQMTDTAWARMALAAQLTGVAEAVRDMASDYAKTRVQFGQPIGAFQAMKHVCANMAIRAEAALAQTSYAALCLVEGTADAAAEAAAAVRIAADAAICSAEDNIQLHGAMGVTEECHAHLYLKRAHLLSLFGGRASWQSRTLLGT